MTTQSEREKIAARWLIEQDDPNFTDAQREELARWLIQSVENCDTYVRMVRAWRWTVLLYRDEAPLVYDKPRGKSAGGSSLDRNFGKLLRAYREERGLSRGELAADSGMRVSEITNIETGVRTLTLTTTYVLARALGVAPSRLVSRLERVMSAKIASRPKRKSR
jgi:DNA-binding XRE family transcriptional regulator